MRRRRCVVADDAGADAARQESSRRVCPSGTTGDWSGDVAKSVNHALVEINLPPATQKRIRELEKQFLERQAATNDVLRLISTSAFDLDTVFKTVITTATRLCRAEHGRIYLLED